MCMIKLIFSYSKVVKSVTRFPVKNLFKLMASLIIKKNNTEAF